MSDSISSTLGSILFTASRSLGGVIPDIVIREQGMDELEITQHPIETGAAVTDHAFKRPATLSLEYGFTNANLSNSLASALATGTLPDITLGNQRVRQIYEQLLALQLSRVPFQVVTGKRLYTRMLLEGLGIMTDAATENALQVSATCRDHHRLDANHDGRTPGAASDSGEHGGGSGQGHGSVGRGTERQHLASGHQRAGLHVAMAGDAAGVEAGQPSTKSESKGIYCPITNEIVYYNFGSHKFEEVRLVFGQISLQLKPPSTETERPAPPFMCNEKAKAEHKC